ncbi:hypothetical protein ES692_05970 [Psychroserpens burtonensis]|uniref:Helix-turn-helix transcriptional regulator n=1 Tax=Psychroserpens burtonensis TaxID=49278 RepID=A0A5C7BAB9_9FLAO|nr:hypothetical protein [Psychroserpens burtonensis]TXE18587.1 hypothetical protein ES692_05970 [Psychroserpens burtonensis]
MNSIVERIAHVAHDTRLNDRQFEMKIGKSTGYLNSIKKRDSYPSVEVILDIVKCFPKYSLEWLMTGKGEMIVSDRNNMVQEFGADYSKPANDFLPALEKYITAIVEKTIEAPINELNHDLLKLLRIDLNNKKNDTNSKKEKNS